MHRTMARGVPKSSSNLQRAALTRPILHPTHHPLILLRQNRSPVEKVKSAGRVDSDARRQDDRVAPQDTQDVLHHGTHIHGVLGANALRKRLPVLRQVNRRFEIFRRYIFRVSRARRLAHLRQPVHLRLVERQVPCRLQVLHVLLLSQQQTQESYFRAPQRESQDVLAFYSIQSLRIGELEQQPQQRIYQEY